MIAPEATRVTAADELRTQLKPLTAHKLIEDCAALDAVADLSTPDAALRHVLSSRPVGGCNCTTARHLPTPLACKPLDVYRSLNAPAEASNSLFKAEQVRDCDPGRASTTLEIAAAEYIDWFEHRRLHGEIGLVPPAQHEANFHRHNTATTTVAASVPCLH